MSDQYRDQVAAIEARWQERWRAAEAFAAPARPGAAKYYCLEMLPYPSGRLHMGHVRNYSIGDAVARFRRMRGDAVLHPMGWDSFGMPAENAAIQRGIHPARWTTENIAAMSKQLRTLGFSYDWTREVAAHRPDYYRWNQWFFLKMLERGLAYRSKREVNWCNSCETVLANEQVESGRCWRCDSVVVRRELEQWFLRLSKYTEELLADLKRLDAWPEAVRTIQENWIGRSEGAVVRFDLAGAGGGVEIFTTRLDTIFGATFCVVAPEHPVLQAIDPASATGLRVQAFREAAAARRHSGVAEEAGKEGIDTGLKVKNPYTGEAIPVWAGDFVLMGYGTGAIMAVPAHDQRDFEFATKHALPIRPVIRPAEGAPPEGPPTAATTEDGVLFGSGRFDGQTSAAARAAMRDFGLAQGFARASVHYRLLDWGISRQRYWGTPIPVIHCPDDGVVPVPEKDLPVLLPEDVPFTGKGGSPLAQTASFLEVSCPKCGKPARRETDTMDTFFDSSWYFYRYCDAKNPDAAFDRDKVGAWFPIDLYIGGINQAHLHLIYCRFFTKVMRDLGLVTIDEPVKRLLCQGMVLKNGTAMSKSKGNTVDPDDMIRRYGADTTRLFTLFAAPPEKDLEWNEQGVEGCYRFLEKVWRLLHPRAAALAAAADPQPGEGMGDPRREALRRKTHQTIARVTLDIEKRLHLNTPVSSLMELLNQMQDFVREETPADAACLREAARAMALLLQPLAPHISEELWSLLGGKELAVRQAWPVADPAWLLEDEVELVVQVNGKVRGHLRVARTMGEAEALALARADARLAAHLEGKTTRKVVYLPGRLLNIVVS